MKIRVLKGTNEIGGSCIEVSINNSTILLDYGTPLNVDSQKISINKNVDAILISHPHQDHFGEIVNIDTEIPIYCGELSLELMNATRIFTGKKKFSNNFLHFKTWQKFTIGDFNITPYLVDHSATDAHAFLIEAKGKKILYSGDFRANGRKSILFEKILKDKNLKNVDVLLMEGTMMKRSNHEFPDEQSVESKIYETLISNDKLSFIVGSSQNIDNIVSAYRASLKAKRVFVIDIYTSWILEVVSKYSDRMPNISWENIKVIKNFGGFYYDKIKSDAKHFGSFKNKVFNDVISLEELNQNPQNYFLKITPSIIEPLLNKLNLKDANIIYSQWLGYTQNKFSDKKTVALHKRLKENYNWVYAHTSGHADLNSLKKFSSSLAPKRLIPIHTEYKNDFLKHFENVLLLEDNEPFSID